MNTEREPSHLDEDFRALPGSHWRRFLAGGGTLDPSEGGLRLLYRGASRRDYTDAQIDDYQGLPRGSFLWRPPLTFRVRARFSHGAGGNPCLLGTAGFGFWNDPFMMTGARVPALPRAIWFFYASPPSNMKLDLQVPGAGWKAATIDAARLPALLWAPAAPLVVPLCRIPSVYRRLWPPVQRSLRICEALVAASMTEWHDYQIEWGTGAARFSVDGQDVLRCPASPRGPLGLVLWIDNQYLAVTPWGHFRYGLLDVPQTQWLELASVTVDRPFVGAS